MIIVIQYRKERADDGRIYIRSEEDNACPICIGVLVVVGVRDRMVTDSSGVIETLVIRRLRCKNCNKIHHELPDMIIPYKRHCAETIENIIVGEVAEVCCDFVTEHRVRTWWTAFSFYFEGLKTSLRMKYEVVFSSVPTPREIVRAVVNMNLWVHTRTAMTPV